MRRSIDCNPVIIRDILNYWSRINFVRKERIDRTTDQYRIHLNVKYDKFKAELESRLKIARYILTVFNQHYLQKG
jgi:hypothetical protein